MPTRPTPSRPGFTLIEAIAAIAILGVLGSIASSIILSAVTSWRDAAVSAQIHDELSAGLERIMKELRAIEPAGNDHPGAPMIASITPTSIAYNDGSVLALSGGDLTLTIGGDPPRVLLADISALSIAAFSESSTPLPSTLAGASCHAVRRIQITATVQRQGVSHTLRTRLFTRAAVSGV